MNIPAFDNATSLDFIVTGADEERAAGAIYDFFQRKESDEGATA